MKITQTDNQIELKSSGVGQLILGIILIAGGIATTVFLLGGPKSDNGQKISPVFALIGLAIVIFGIAFAIFAKNRAVTIQKGGDTTVKAKRILGGGPQQQSVPTANIVAVRLSTYMNNVNTTNSGGNPANSRRSVLSLVLNNNDLVEVGSSGSKGGFSVNGFNVSSLISKAPLSKEANQTAAFIGVPLQADDTSSIAGAVQAVKAAITSDSAPSQPTTTSFNPNPQPPTTPAAPAPPTPTPQPQAPTPIPQTPQQIPPPENPGGPPSPTPPSTPQQ